MGPGPTPRRRPLACSGIYGLHPNRPKVDHAVLLPCLLASRAEPLHKAAELSHGPHLRSCLPTTDRKSAGGRRLLCNSLCTSYRTALPVPNR